MKQKLLIAALLTTMGTTTSALAGDLLDTMTSDGGFKTMLSAIKTADMESDFKAAGPITVFAPTDFAFSWWLRHAISVGIIHAVLIWPIFALVARLVKPPQRSLFSTP